MVGTGACPIARQPWNPSPPDRREMSSAGSARTGPATGLANADGLAGGNFVPEEDAKLAAAGIRLHWCAGGALCNS
jgi:hypothetical protein